MTQRKVALIGTGGIARAHVQAVRAAEDRAYLAAAVDIDSERVAAFCTEHDIPAHYTDAAQMLTRKQPELVLICTPPGLHAALSIQALDAGAWVLCEKPLCASLAELDQIQAAEGRNSGYCASVFQWRFGSGGQHLHRLIQDETMGKLLVGLCNTVWYRDTGYYAVPWRGKWETELGGPTMGHGIHAMDFFLWLMGDWLEVRAMMDTLDRDIETEDTSMALVRFERGAMGSIVNSVLSPRQESYLRFDFQQATVELSHLYRYTNDDWRYSLLPGATTTADLTAWQTIPQDHLSSHDIQVAALLDDMAANRRPLTSGAEARRTIEFLTSLYKSAITGQPVARGSIMPDDPFYHRLNGIV